MTLITVREHARLTTGQVPPDAGLDAASISQPAFDWLCAEAQRHRLSGAPLVQVEGRQWLRVDNYVGVLETPCGTRLEILPKHTASVSDAATSRRLLVRMLRHALNLPVRMTSPTDLATFNAPVSEWVIQQFLGELALLIRRGVRSEYRAVEEEVAFLRGRLRVGEQIRQPVSRRHRFQVEHQVFDANRAENRLIVAALTKVANQTREPGNWRLAHELEHPLLEVPASQDVPADLRRWSTERLMSHYEPIRPWCELILGDRSPLSAFGEWRGRSLLFPMEKVFERYVEVCLRRALPSGATLRAQAASQYLCVHRGRRLFQLRPDFLLEQGDSVSVLDAKWKLLDARDVEQNYRLSQADFYQLFAYGHRYRKGAGALVLIYPRCEAFPEPVEPFDLQDGAVLYACPFDLDAGVLLAGCALESLAPVGPPPMTGCPLTSS